MLALSLPRTPAALACPLCQDGLAGPLVNLNSNAAFFPGDSVSACPAGDSIVANVYQALPHPSRLRLEVYYNDASCHPKPGVPPDSIWVTWTTASGNARINDQGQVTYADDTTNSCGFARITFPSVSGTGTIALTVYVSGRSLGTKNVVVRTTDPSANGVVGSEDLMGLVYGDLNYDGLTDIHDLLRVMNVRQPVVVEDGHS